ncbi:unnamed protein product, partial [Iphiclides podalirius]
MGLPFDTCCEEVIKGGAAGRKFPRCPRGRVGTTHRRRLSRFTNAIPARGAKGDKPDDIGAVASSTNCKCHRLKETPIQGRAHFKTQRRQTSVQFPWSSKRADPRQSARAPGPACPVGMSRDEVVKLLGVLMSGTACSLSVCGGAGVRPPLDSGSRGTSGP